ncbi:hypothetical protein [Kiloniella sp. EL199]|uniref:hypothetical protein n=1 Tax=Kiloniella sp. EL199 TaxID=2107581 RepID=UPI000EA3582C|nr:hypothetical protein [Kiloniella sp. EL199]
MKFIIKTFFVINLCMSTNIAFADNTLKEGANFTEFENTFEETMQKLNLEYEITGKKCETGPISYCSYHVGNDSILMTKGQKFSKLTASVSVVNGDRSKFLLLAISAALIVDPSLDTDEVTQIIKDTVTPVLTTQNKRAEVTANGFKYWATRQYEKMFFYNIIRNE